MAWSLPFPCGAPDLTYEQERDAILAEHEGVIGDVSDGTELEIEVRGEAIAVAMIRAISARQANQNFPRRMLDGIPKWEEALGLRPTSEDSTRARALAIESRLRGFAGNALPDIEAMAQSTCGVNFSELRTVATADEVTYWAGVNPGPPGFEYTSNRAHVAVVMTKDGLTEAQFVAKRNQVVDMLDDLRPDWLTYSVGTDGMIADVGIVGQGIVA